MTEQVSIDGLLQEGLEMKKEAVEAGVYAENPEAASRKTLEEVERAKRLLAQKAIPVAPPVAPQSPPIAPQSPPVASPPPQSPAEEEPDGPVDPLEYIQENFKDAPSSQEIEKWKSLYKDVYVVALSDDEVFIFRGLSRLEFRKIRQETTAAEQNALSQDDATVESLAEERIVALCTLWPKIGVNDMALSKAGTFPTLKELILRASNFKPLAEVLSTVRKL